MEINLQLFFFQYATQISFMTLCGKRIDFLNAGTWNIYSGPDFKMVQYAVDGEIFHGDVEIHLRSSDWFAHGHDHDPAFDHVSIHFVADCNTIVNDNMLHIQAPDDWSNFPLVTINVRNPQTFDQDYKCRRLLNWAEVYGYENTAFIHLARALGRHVQGDAMEKLAIQLLPFIKEKKIDAKDLAILFHGCAGHLNENLDLPFYELWKNTFRKFCPLELPTLPWNNKVNIPSRQWLKVSQMIHLHLLTNSMGYTVLLNQPHVLKELLSQIQGMSYWEYHYRFGQKLPYKSKIILSKSAQEGIFMNTIPIWELAFKK